MIVFLIGMPACGKTSIGRRLAQKLQINFIDLDKHLSAKENKSVSKIFSEEGESAFRELETKYLKEISSTSLNTVIAVGGGTPCYHDNLNFMLSIGKVIYINTPIEILFSRLQDDTKRPMFIGLSENEKKEKLNSIFKQRESYYTQANYIIDTAYKSDDAIVEEISSKITKG